MMLNIKVERVIFVVILISMIIVFGEMAIAYKMNMLSINADASPEGIIEYEYRNYENYSLEYKYEIIGNHMFVVGSSKLSDYGQFTRACKVNSKSGFLFEMPGLIRFPIYNTKIETIRIPNGDNISILISKYKNEYTIEIWDLKENNVSYYLNGQDMDTLSMDNIVNYESIAVLNLDQEIEIYGIQDGQQFSIINKDKIVELF